MTHTFFIQLPSALDAPADTVNWALFEGNQKTAGGTARPLQEALTASQQADNTTIVALLPACDVLQTSISVPAGQKRHLQHTLPFLVEENIAAPIEDMHLSLGTVQHGRAKLLAASRDAMHSWCDWLKSHQLDADWLLPTTAALAPNQQLEVLLTEQAAYFNAPQQTMVCAHLDDLSFVADTLLNHASGEPVHEAKVVVEQALLASHQAAIASLSSQLEVTDIKIEQLKIGSAFDFVCQTIQSQLDSGTKPINLFSGDFPSLNKRQTSKAPRWRLLAAMVVLCVITKVGFDLGTGIYLDQQSEQLDQQITTLYRELFPQDKRIINPKVQMQNHLNQQSGQASNAGFMTLFSYVAAALDEINEPANNLLQQLRYNDNNQSLMVDIQIKNVQQLEQLKQIIESHQVSVSILSANEEQQWIKGRLRLTL